MPTSTLGSEITYFVPMGRGWYTKTVERVVSGSLRVDGSSLDVCRHCEEHEVESVHTPTVLAEGSPNHTDGEAECPPCASRSLDVDSQLPA
eukprot:1458072-Amphidinium_carterae.1